MEFDILSLQRNKKPFILGNVALLQPTLGEIADIGYSEYQKYLYTIIATSKDIADILWFDMKIWYEDIKNEWDFFIQKCLSKSKTINIIIDGHDDIIQGIGIANEYRDALNFFFNTTGEYVVMDKIINNQKQVYLYNVTLIDENKEIYLLNNKNCKFTNHYYEILVEYLRKVNWVYNDYDFLHGGTKKAKKYILEQKYKDRKKKKKKQNITLDSIVSSLIAKSQSYSEIWDYPIYMIYDLYYRYIKFSDWETTMQAVHSGCIDTKKNPINWDKINWSGVIN